MSRLLNAIKSPFVKMKWEMQREMYKKRIRVNEKDYGVKAQTNWIVRAFTNTENQLVYSIGLSGFLATLYFTQNYYGCVKVWQHSMSPTLKHQEVLFIKKFSRGRWFFEDYSQNDLKHGDIVIFKHPKNPERLEVKRVIGLPRDTIQPVKSTIQVDIDPEPVTIKGGHVFLEGDNMSGNHRQDDSNRFGQVPMGLAEGAVIGKMNWEGSWLPAFSSVERAVPKERVTFNRMITKKEIKDLGDLKHEDMLVPGSRWNTALNKESMQNSTTDLLLAHINEKKKHEYKQESQAGKLGVGAQGSTSEKSPYQGYADRMKEAPPAATKEE